MKSSPSYQRIKIGPLDAALYSLSQKSNDLPVILCFHGFTGSGKDFQALQCCLEGKFELLVCDWFGHGLSDSPAMLDFYSLGYSHALVCQLIRKIKSTRKLAGVLGYSMGARLLAASLVHLHRLKMDAPKAVFISLSPGLTSESERAHRRAQDLEWFHFLKSNSIGAFASKWEAQPIISSQLTIPSPYREEVYNRRRQNNAQGLAHAVLGFSPGYLPPLKSNYLGEALLITGEKDLKYNQMAENLVAKTQVTQHLNIANSHHSPHLERPKETADSIASYLGSL